jgi:hypothetical protein
MIKVSDVVDVKIGPLVKGSSITVDSAVKQLVSITPTIRSFPDSMTQWWYEAMRGEGFSWNAEYMNALRTARDFFATQKDVSLYCAEIYHDGSAVVSSTTQSTDPCVECAEGDSSARKPTST